MIVNRERRVVCRLRAFQMRKSRDIAILLICLLIILAHSPLYAEEIRFSGMEKLVNDVDFPVALYTPNIAPTNATFYKDRLIFGAWNTGEIIGFRIKDGRVVEENVLYKHVSGITDVKFFPDGYLYFLSGDGIYRADLRI